MALVEGSKRRHPLGVLEEQPRASGCALCICSLGESEILVMMVSKMDGILELSHLTLHSYGEFLQ